MCRREWARMTQNTAYDKFVARIRQVCGAYGKFVARFLGGELQMESFGGR